MSEYAVLGPYPVTNPSTGKRPGSQRMSTGRLSGQKLHSEYDDVRSPAQQAASRRAKPTNRRTQSKDQIALEPYRSVGEWSTTEKP